MLAAAFVVAWPALLSRLYSSDCWPLLLCACTKAAKAFRASKTAKKFHFPSQNKVYVQNVPMSVRHSARSLLLSVMIAVYVDDPYYYDHHNRNVGLAAGGIGGLALGALLF